MWREKADAHRILTAYLMASPSWRAYFLTSKKIARRFAGNMENAVMAHTAALPIFIG